jgi:hypothetical protein
MLRFGNAHVADTNIYYRLLKNCEMSESDINEMILSKYIAGYYYDFHTRRFAELHGTLAILDAERPIKRLLEISTMPYTTGIWRSYLKHLDQVTTVDLPTNMGGPVEADVLQFGSNSHLQTDLNHTDLNIFSARIVENGKFDVIIATEIVEHLQRDFSEIAEFLLKCLSPNGVAIVTTPNPIRENNILTLINGRNPQHRFTEYNSNHGGHFHFREYSMVEMVEDVVAKGGEIFSQVYSSCWNNDWERHKSEDSYHLRENIVLMFGRPGSEQMMGAFCKGSARLEKN